MAATGGRLLCLFGMGCRVVLVKGAGFGFLALNRCPKIILKYLNIIIAFDILMLYYYHSLNKRPSRPILNGVTNYENQ